MALLPILLCEIFIDAYKNLRTRFTASHRAQSTGVFVLQAKLEASKALEPLSNQTSNTKSEELNTETAAVGQDGNETVFHQQSDQYLATQGLIEKFDSTPGEDFLGVMSKIKRLVVSELQNVENVFMSEICKLSEENSRQISHLRNIHAIEILNLRKEIISEIDNARKCIKMIYSLCAIILGAVVAVGLYVFSQGLILIKADNAPSFFLQNGVLYN